MKNDPSTLKNTLEIAHSRFPLAGTPPNALLTLDPELLQFLQGILNGSPIPPPERTSTEWNHLIILLNTQWVRPILTWLLLKASPEFHPPVEIMQGLRTDYLRSKANSFVEDMQARKILTAFEENGITPIFLKGFALARTVYPETAMRIGSDIDILLPANKISECSRILIKLGYEIPVDYYCLSPSVYYHQNTYPGKGLHGSPLEVHWRLDTGFDLHSKEIIEEIFSRAFRVSYRDLSFLTMDPVDHLLFSAYHAIFQHNSGIRINWLYDLYLLSKDLTPAQWEVLKLRSVEWNTRLAVEYGLRLAELWTPCKIPLAYSDFSQWPEPGPKEIKAWKYAPTLSTSIRSSIIMTIRGCPTIKEKAGYMLRFVFPPPKIMRRKGYYQEENAIIFTYLHYWCNGLKHIKPGKKS